MAEQKDEKNSVTVDLTVPVAESLMYYVKRTADRFGLSIEELVNINLLSSVVAANISELRSKEVPPSEQHQPLPELAVDETPPAFTVPVGPVPALERIRHDRLYAGRSAEKKQEEESEDVGRKPPIIELLPDSNPGAFWTHVVSPGDTLSSIAAQYYGDSSQFPRIAVANNISEPYVIYVGDTLVVPKPELSDAGAAVFASGCQAWKNHIVQPGDTLTGIAAQFYGNGSEYWRIANCNNIQPPNYYIYVGDSLAIPAQYM